MRDMFPRIDGISFCLPNDLEAYEIEKNTKKIIEKAKEVSDDLGIERKKVYESIGFDPQNFVDEYSSNYIHHNSLIPIDEVSSLVMKQMEELRKPETNTSHKSGKMRKSLKAVGLAGLIIGSYALGGCLSAAEPNDADPFPEENNDPVTDADEMSNYFFSGMGRCSGIGIGEDYIMHTDYFVRGMLRDNLTISNGHSFPPGLFGYSLNALDLETGEIKHKYELPNRVEIRNFKGFCSVSSDFQPWGQYGATFRILGFGEYGND